MLIEDDRSVVLGEVRSVGRHFPVAYLPEAPNGHASHLRLPVVQGGCDRGENPLEVIAGHGAEPSNGPEGAGAEMVEVFLGHAHDEANDDGHVVGEHLGPAADDFRHRFRGPPAHPARFFAQEPVEFSQVAADELGVVFGDAVRGKPHGFDGPPGDLLVRIEGERDQQPQHAPFAHRQFGDLFEIALVEQFPQVFLDWQLGHGVAVGTCGTRGSGALSILLKLKMTQTIHHEGTEKTEVVVIDLAANFVQRTNHRILVRSVFSVSLW